MGMLTQVKIDREKVLTLLEICGKNRDCSDCCPYGRASEELCRENLMADALALLKEQEAVKPKHNTLSPTSWFCGKCGMCISRFHDYCPSCGQAVKWDE